MAEAEGEGGEGGGLKGCYQGGDVSLGRGGGGCGDGGAPGEFGGLVVREGGEVVDVDH